MLADAGPVLESSTWAWLGPLIGGAVVAVTGGVVKIMSARQQIRSADRKELSGEWQQIFDRQQADLSRLTAQMATQERETDALRERERLCELRCERMSARIEILEDALQRANIPFRPFRPDPPPGGPP
jgi:hypothetical protein